ncbi:putative membrane protein YuzA [Marinithermofilum abyssi]|uniref:Putative membrane protein YuzA n=1 Tax=Marinithermofilum abyssi TaxID=1571185 RepID=A0A8J2YD68_9BACL|nr:putative membrane protein YuzA [Marinithermofilum abyssi]
MGLSRLALILVIIGALNWLLIGLFQWDLVSSLFGGDAVRESSGLSRVIYALIGLAGLYSIKFLFENREPARAD